jgi:hypothetical protein
VHQRDVHPHTQRVEIGAVLPHVVLVQRDPVGQTQWVLEGLRPYSDVRSGASRRARRRAVRVASG